MNQTFVSVIIPTYKDWPRLKLCLAALSKQTYPQDQFEVIVVNNDPEESCPFDLPTSNMKIITEAKPGSYAARNAGIKIAKGEILAFTDSDCIPEPSWIDAGAIALKAGFDRVAGRVEIFFKSKKPTTVELYEELFSFKQEQNVLIHKAGITANLFTIKTVFSKVGLFDSSLFSGGDIEWGWRARDMNVSIVYSPDATVLHPARRTIGEMLKKRKRVVGGSIAFRKNQVNKSKLWFVKGFLPPAQKTKHVLRHKNLSLIDKFALLGILYVLYVNDVLIRLIIHLGVGKKSRV